MAAMQLVDFLETAVLLVPEWHELKRYPRDSAQPQTQWRTDTLTTLQVGPVDLLAGDVLDVRLEHEFDAEMDGASAYTVGGQQSEHWYLWIMGSTSARLRVSSGVYIDGVLPPKEQNWDWLIHHLAVCRSIFW